MGHQEEVLKRREEGLKRKDIELQESLIRFSKFLQESDSKRSRALKKAADERKACEEKEKEVDQLVSTYEQLHTDYRGRQKEAVVQSNLHNWRRPLEFTSSQIHDFVWIETVPTDSCSFTLFKAFIQYNSRIQVYWIMHR